MSQAESEAPTKAPVSGLRTGAVRGRRLSRWIAVTGLSAAAMGCGALKDKTDGSSVLDGLALALPAHALVGEGAALTVNHPDSVKTFAWSVGAGGIESFVCDSPSGPVHTCTFEVPGTVSVTLKATDYNGESRELTGSLDILDPAAPADQAPVLVLRLLEDGNEIARISTFRESTNGAAVVSQGREVTFDFSQTTDAQDPADTLTYTVESGGDVAAVPARSTRTFDSVDAFPFTVAATDPSGNKATKTFILFVQCKDVASYPPVKINPDLITVTPESIHNYFNYAVDPAGVSGGKAQGPYQFMWDANGDGTYDTPWLDLSSARLYSVYGGVRSVQLKVRDTGCNIFGSVNLGGLTPPREALKIPFADGVPGTPQRPQIGDDYFFIQARLAGASGNTEASANAEMIATWRKDDAPRRVSCDYRKQRAAGDTSGASIATFEIGGFNWYDKPGESGIRHGLRLVVTDIIDLTGTAAAAAPGPDGAVQLPPSGTLKVAGYQTDEFSDDTTRRIYQKNAGCQFNMDLKAFPPGTGTCDSNPALAYSITADGTFSCPDLVSADGRHLSATQGAFYCEVAKINACPPGGGGGGGLPPTPK